MPAEPSTHTVRDRPYPVPTEVEVIREVPKEVIREVIKEVIREVPVEVPVEVIKEVPVEVRCRLPNMIQRARPICGVRGVRVLSPRCTSPFPCRSGGPHNHQRGAS